jgi:hypothetical protein
MRSPRRTRHAPHPGPVPAEVTGEDTVVWTADRIGALGATTDLATAAILGVSRSAAYKLAGRDAFPVPLLRVGAHYRVPTAPLLSVLHLQPALGAAGSGNDRRGGG